MLPLYTQLDLSQISHQLSFVHLRAKEMYEEVKTRRTNRESKQAQIHIIVITGNVSDKVKRMRLIMVKCRS